MEKKIASSANGSGESRLCVEDSRQVHTYHLTRISTPNGCKTSTENKSSSILGVSSSQHVCQGSLLSLNFILLFFILFPSYVFFSLYPTSPLCIYYDFEFSVFMERPSVQMSGPLFLVSSLMSFFFCLCCPILMCQFLSHLIILYYIIIYQKSVF